MNAFGIIFLAVLGFGYLTGFFGLFLLAQSAVQSGSADWSRQRRWIAVWTAGCVAEVGGWLLRSAAQGKAGAGPQYVTLGTLLMGLGPTLFWPVAVFVLRPHRTELKRLMTPQEEPAKGVWPLPPTNTG